MIVAVVHPQTGQQFPQRCCVIVNAHRFVVSTQHGIFFAPNLIPVNFRLCFFTYAVNHLLNFFFVCIKLNQFVQCDALERRQTFRLANVRQCFIGFPFGNGLAADSQLFGYIFLRKSALFSCVVQAASQAHCSASFVFCVTSITRRQEKIHQSKLSILPVFFPLLAGFTHCLSFNKSRISVKSFASSEILGAGACSSFLR